MLFFVYYLKDILTCILCTATNLSIKLAIQSIFYAPLSPVTEDHLTSNLAGSTSNHIGCPTLRLYIVPSGHPTWVLFFHQLRFDSHQLTLVSATSFYILFFNSSGFATSLDFERSGSSSRSQGCYRLAPSSVCLHFAFSPKT